MQTQLLKSINLFLQNRTSEQKLNKEIECINTDSRTIKENEIFLALKGSNFDGNQFIFTALKQVDELSISDYPVGELSSLPDYSEELLPKIISVESSLQAYHQIASIYRKLTNPLVIGITGSSGKTTTKELLKTVLERNFRIHYTEANYNNEIGVPKTILSMPQDTEVLILEMAMRGLKQIELLSKTAQPNITVITNIGTAHIELLGSKENIRKAKTEILYGLNHYHGWMKLDSSFVIDEDLYDFFEERKFIDLNTKQRINAKQIIKFDSAQNFQIKGLASAGLMADINAVAKVAELLGLNKHTVQAELLRYSPGKGRGEFIEDANGNIIIDETYNANPEAVRNSVYAMLSEFPSENKIAVIGEILESQNELITELFDELASIQRNDFKFIDARNKDIKSISEEIKHAFSKDRQNICLVKASRGAKLERIFEELKLLHS